MYQMTTTYIDTYFVIEISMYNIKSTFHVSKLLLSKSMPSFSDPSDEVEEVSEVSSSSSLATNALSSSNCNPTSPGYETQIRDLLL